MAKKYLTYKFTYNTTTETLIIKTSDVTRTPEEKTVIRETPTGARYKQIYGSGKYRWSFTFQSNTARALLTSFNAVYENQSDYTITMQEENDDATFTSYTVIVNRPVYTPLLIDSSSPVDQGLRVEVFEA